MNHKRVISVFAAKIENIRKYHPEVALTPEYVNAILDETYASFAFADYTRSIHKIIASDQSRKEASEAITEKHT